MNKTKTISIIHKHKWAVGHFFGGQFDFSVFYLFDLLRAHFSAKRMICHFFMTLKKVTWPRNIFFLSSVCTWTYDKPMIMVGAEGEKSTQVDYQLSSAWNKCYAKKNVSLYAGWPLPVSIQLTRRFLSGQWTGGKEARYANVMQVVPSLIDLTFSKSAESLAKFLIHLLV